MPGDMTSDYLCSHTRYNSKLYVRPIQRDIDVDSTEEARRTQASSGFCTVEKGTGKEERQKFRFQRHLQEPEQEVGTGFMARLGSSC